MPNITTCLNGLETPQEEVLHTAVCMLDGSWESNLDDFCSGQSTLTITFNLYLSVLQ